MSATSAAAAVRDDRIPCPEVKRLRGLAFHFRHRPEFVFEIQAGNIAHHGADEAVILRRQLKERIRRIRLAGGNGTDSCVIESKR